jgi:predicted SprT family Zn-dependent metalloprotease
MEREKEIEQENAHLFLYQLMAEFEKANKEIFRHLNQKLVLPRFVAHSGSSYWGCWKPKMRKMSFSIDLMRNYEWGAVKHVLLHEMAHMIVGEIFHMEDGRSHGEAFAKACKVLGVDNRRCCSKDYLMGFKGKDGINPELTKIRKLMAKGSCSSATEAESHAFTVKAKSLMRKYNLSNRDVMGTDKLFIKRPVGGKYKRFPQWLHSLGHLVCDNYSVQYIQTYQRDPRSYEMYYFIELFGEPHNLEVAEYVFHVVQSQGEAAYLKHKNDPNRKRSYRKLSKPAFMKGVVKGYSSTLAKPEEDEVEDFEESALLSTDDQILKEKHRQAYDRMRTTRTAGYTGAGGYEGRAAGKGISVSTGVNGGSGSLRIGG